MGSTGNQPEGKGTDSSRPDFPVSVSHPVYSTRLNTKSTRNAYFAFLVIGVK